MEYRGATPVTGKHSVPSLGTRPSAAVVELRRLVESPAERRPEPSREQMAARQPALRAAAGVRLGS